MIRFITHILDIKNVLGMQRSVPFPDPLWDVNKLVLVRHGGTGNISFLFSGGSVNVTETVGGTETTSTYTTSPASITLNGDNDTYITISPSVTRITNLFNEITYMALDNLLAYTLLPANLEILDLRNASLLSGILMSYPTGIKRIYANCTGSSKYNISKNAMVNSNVPDGTIYIKRGETYTNNLVADANNKGWEVVLYD